MNNSKLELFKAYIYANVCPILIDNIDIDIFKNISVIIKNDITKEELNGSLNKKPEWYKELEDSNKIILIIEDIDKISKEEQLKFHELLKYRKVGKYNLKNNVVIILTASKISSDTISENIYSLISHITE